MSDFHSINEAINERAGRKLLPSIAVALIIFVLVFTTVSFAPVLFAVLVGIAVLLAIRELVRAYASGGIVLPEGILMLASVGVLCGAWFGKVSGLAVAIAIAIPNTIVYLLIRDQKDFIRRSTSSAFAIFYIAFLAGFIILLGHHHDAVKRILILVLAVTCNDTFGYLVGLLFGRHKLAPHISPKKSWEGLIGSLVACIVILSLAMHYLFHERWWVGALIGVMAVLTATSGDLIESAVKRDLSIKDMGSILPGHGGILDRIDSVLFTGPAIWFALELIKHFQL